MILRLSPKYISLCACFNLFFLVKLVVCKLKYVSSMIFKDLLINQLWKWWCWYSLWLVYVLADWRDSTLFSVNTRMKSDYNLADSQLTLVTNPASSLWSRAIKRVLSLLSAAAPGYCSCCCYYCCFFDCSITCKLFLLLGLLRISSARFFQFNTFFIRSQGGQKTINSGYNDIRNQFDLLTSRSLLLAWLCVKLAQLSFYLLLARLCCLLGKTSSGQLNLASCPRKMKKD